MDSTFVSELCGCDSLPPAACADLMSVSEAVALALAQVSPIRQVQSVSLDDACGRVTRDAIFASRAMPLFDNSAMDGFALHCADLTGRSSLPIAGTVSAGDVPRTLPKGAAMRIYTGAPLPRGADAVAMIERCCEAGGRVRFIARPSPGDNIRHTGSDQAEGQMMIPANTRIAPHHIGLLAANGIARVDVVRRPRVAVLSSGDELSTGIPAPGQIPDANRPMLIALARQTGAEVTDLDILPDTPDAITETLAQATGRYDLILSSGAASMGGKDHMRDALAAAGGHVTGWRVAIKPGKPVIFGRLGQTTFTGLPGNPFAAFVGFHLFAAAQIGQLMGVAPARFAQVPARAGFDWRRKPGRAEVFPVRLAAYDGAGVPTLERLGRSVSATLLPLAAAQGLAIVSADTDRVRAGDPLRWQPFSQLGDMS